MHEIINQVQVPCAAIEAHALARQWEPGVASLELLCSKSYEHKACVAERAAEYQKVSKFAH